MKHRTLYCVTCNEVMSFDVATDDALTWLDNHKGHSIDEREPEFGPCFRCGSDGPVGMECPCFRDARRLGESLIVAGIQIGHMDDDVRSVVVIDTGHQVILRATATTRIIEIDTWPPFTMEHWKRGNAAHEARG